MRQVDQLNNTQLSIDDLKIKLDQLAQDIKAMQSESGHEKQVSILLEYQDYLKDELKTLEKGKV